MFAWAILLSGMLLILETLTAKQQRKREKEEQAQKRKEEREEKKRRKAEEQEQKRQAMQVKKAEKQGMIALHCLLVERACVSSCASLTWLCFDAQHNAKQRRSKPKKKRLVAKKRSGERLLKLPSETMACKSVRYHSIVGLVDCC
jgi:hypothetical protein